MSQIDTPIRVNDLKPIKTHYRPLRAMEPYIHDTDIESKTPPANTNQYTLLLNSSHEQTGYIYWLLLIRARKDCEFESADVDGNGSFDGVSPTGNRRAPVPSPIPFPVSRPPVSVAVEAPRLRSVPLLAPFRLPPVTPDGRSWLGWNRGIDRGKGLVDENASLSAWLRLRDGVRADEDGAR